MLRHIRPAERPNGSSTALHRHLHDDGDALRRPHMGVHRRHRLGVQRSQPQHQLPLQALDATVTTLLRNQKPGSDTTDPVFFLTKNFQAYLTNKIKNLSKMTKFFLYLL